MRFEDLPRDWAQRPVTDPDVFDGVVDLIVTDRSRAHGATWALLCHGNGHLLQPVLLEHERPDADPAEVRHGLDRLLTEAARQGVLDVALVAARPGPAGPTPRDHELRAAFEAACRDAGVTLLAVAVAGDDDVRTLAAEGGSAAA